MALDLLCGHHLVLLAGARVRGYLFGSCDTSRGVTEKKSPCLWCWLLASLRGQRDVLKNVPHCKRKEGGVLCFCCEEAVENENKRYQSNKKNIRVVIPLVSCPHDLSALRADIGHVTAVSSDLALLACQFNVPVGPLFCDCVPQ